MTNVRRTLAVKVATPGGDNPLLLRLVGSGPFVRGVPVAGLSLVGQGGTPPYAYTLVSEAGTLPPGLSLDPLSRAITGTPSATGHFPFVAKVQDAASNVYLARFAIEIIGQLFVVAGNPTPGEIGVPYSYQFVVRDITGTTITSGYSVTSGNTPAGLTVNAAGLLSGTPTLPDGISYFTVTCTDGTDSIEIPCKVTVYPELTVTFQEDRDPPNGWGGAPGSWLPSMIYRQDWIAHIIITGGVPPYSLSVLDGAPLPANIKLDPRTRTVFGRTTEAADTDPKFFGIGVKDALGGFDNPQRVFFIVDSQQGRIRPQKDGVDVGADGPLAFNFEMNDDATLDVLNDGSTVTVKLPQPSEGGGVAAINGVEPDSGGNVSIVSDEPGMLDVGQNSAGDIALKVGRPELYVAGLIPNGVSVGIRWPGDPGYEGYD